jgi:presequence protease
MISHGDRGMSGTPFASFKLAQKQVIKALNLTVFTYDHPGTGARHIHLAADADELVFLVALRTIPENSTGVAHVLEHTALCGSERYPVRDPFFMMTRRSLNTFMNAFTSSDWTAYPFATKNKKDFYNLLNVYLDATFFARLDELDFAQEGHRVNFSKVGDSKSELVYQGVVYNEMKGAMSAPTSRLWQHLTTQMFPSTTYHYNSGGEPADIPRLTYAYLQQFYQQFYHPTNAVFMTYGRLDVAEFQQVIQENVLHRFMHEPAYRGVIHNEPVAQPVQVEHAYPAASDKDQTHIVKAWLLGESHDVFSLLEGSLLGQVLLDNSSCPLYAALEETSLAKAPSPLCGVSDDCKQMMFVAGVQGSNLEQVEAVESLIMDCLQQVADQGIAYEQLAAALHQIELSRREVTGGRYPYGLQLILTMMPAVVHGENPGDLLALDKPLKRLAGLIKKPGYIKGLVRKLLLDNTHSVRLVLAPDTEYAHKEQVRVAAELAKKKKAMSAKALQDIVGLNKALVQRQKQDDDPEQLPKVTLADIAQDFPYAKGVFGYGGLPVSFYPQGTNGLVYQDVVYPLASLSSDQIKHLPYLMMMVGELGAGSNTYQQMQAMQAQVSGGIWGDLQVNTMPDDLQHTYALFYVGGKSLVQNYKPFNQFLQHSMTDMRFDEVDHMREVVAQARKHAEQALVGRGHTLAMLAASSVHTPLSRWVHSSGGLAGIKALQELDGRLDDPTSLTSFANDLKALYSQLLSSPHELLLVGQQEYAAKNLKALKKGWKFASKKAPISIVTPFQVPDDPVSKRQMWLINAQVNYCAKAYLGVAYNHEDAPLLAVLAHVLRNGFLHRVIREQGGAYGGGASYQADAGIFRFYSYRDPRLLETLDDFDAAVKWVLAGDWPDRLVEEAILEAVSQFDKPCSPASEAKNAYYDHCFDRDYPLLVRYRTGLMQATKDELIRVAQTYLIQEQESIAVVTNKAAQKRYGSAQMQVFSLLNEA